MTRYIIIIFLSITIFSSCKKYLDEKPKREQLVPYKLEDLLALLDYDGGMNRNTSSLTEAITDNVIHRDNSTAFNNKDEKDNYLWDKNATHVNSWRLSYANPIYYSNVVLDVLPGIKYSSDQNDLYNYVKGAALYYRAFTYQRLADLYCKPYSDDVKNEPGIVLRKSAGVEEESYRGTIQETYDLIINNLKESAVLLPEEVSFTTRPTKAAAYGLLARTYLSMRDYNNAFKYADSCLGKRSGLMNFNDLTPGGIRRFNVETVFYNHTIFTLLVNPNFGARVDSTLYNSYEADDLRSKVYFSVDPDGSVRFRGSYDSQYGPMLIFDGITTDEMYLVRAECYARAGNKEKALEDLNNLLRTRWKKDINGVSLYVDKTADNAADALQIILTERRKELVFRGLRWSDIRRLNLEGANITLTRKYNGTTYTLEPNSKRTVLLIPNEVIKLTNIQQNPR